jgi:hypothetical protein
MGERIERGRPAARSDGSAFRGGKQLDLHPADGCDDFSGQSEVAWVKEPFPDR